MVGEMNKQLFQPSTSKIGDLDAKYMILIVYFGTFILGLIPGVKYVAWLIPLIVFLIDKENKFIAFHAIQAFLLEIAAVIIAIILGIVAFATAMGAAVGAAAFNPYAISASLGAGAAVIIIGGVIGILFLVCAIIAAIKGYKYEIYEIPLVGKWAEKIVFKTSN